MRHYRTTAWTGVVMGLSFSLASTGCSALPLPGDDGGVAESGDSLSLHKEAADSNTESPRVRGVTTRLTVYWDSAAHMDTTFVAVPDSYYALWNVSTGFVPGDVVVTCENFGCAPGVWELKGRAAANATQWYFETETQGTAGGCYWKARHSNQRIPAQVYCTFSIDSSGVASLSNLTFSYPYP